VTCDSGCATCNSDGVCVEKCSTKCKDCISSPSLCIECDDDMVLMRTSGGYSQTCVKNCTELYGFFYNSTTNTCD